MAPPACADNQLFYFHKSPGIADDADWDRSLNANYEFATECGAPGSGFA